MFFNLLLFIELTLIFCLAIYYIGVFFYEFQKVFIKIPTLMTKHESLTNLLLVEKITNNDVVFDLGSGSGKTIFYINKVTGAKTHGYEISILPFIYSLIIKYFYNYNTKLYLKNFCNADFKKATVIYTYLSDPMMHELTPTLNTQIKMGKKIISCDFQLPNNTPIRRHSFNKNTFYIYSL